MENARKTNTFYNKLHKGYTDSYYSIFCLFLFLFSELDTFCLFSVFDFETRKMPKEKVFWIISFTKATLIPV